MIERPNYPEVLKELEKLSAETTNYIDKHKLKSLPNYFKLWFAKGKEDRLRDIIDQMEHIIEILGNTESYEVLTLLNSYPTIPPRAHLKPFKIEWIDTIIGIVLPVGVFFTIRIWVFRMRLLKDLKEVLSLNNKLDAVLNGIIDAEVEDK